MSEKPRKCFLEVPTSGHFCVKSLALKESPHSFYAINARLERIRGDGKSQVLQAEMRYRFCQLEKRRVRKETDKLDSVGVG